MSCAALTALSGPCRGPSEKEGKDMNKLHSPDSTFRTVRWPFGEGRQLSMFAGR